MELSPPDLADRPDHGAAPWSPSSSAAARQLCDDFASRTFPGVAISPAAFQGACSYTLCVGPDDVVQFRPPAHRIYLDTAAAAAAVYGAFAPPTAYIGVVRVPATGEGVRREDVAAADPHGNDMVLYAYHISRIPGTALADSRPRRPHQQAADDRLVRDFARLVAQSWRCALEPAAAAPLRGRVGASLGWRLELLRDGLPARFGPVVLDVLAHLADIEALPWAFTHGDLVPGNVMVAAAEPGQMRISGLIDWAEAEYLPLGVGLYGLEEFLGESTEAPLSSGGQYPPPGSTFAYFPTATRLRDAFWDELETQIPELRGGQNNHLRATVERARVLGILLWHGIAFDGGRLDRVVAEGVDDAEIQRLDLFLLDGAAAPGPDDEPIEDPNEAILDDVIDEDDSADPSPPSGAIVRPESVPPSNTQDLATDRRPSFGRKAWEYVRRLGKL
ncbi:hypothetical protein RB594_007479 [Gaeumannomyces avenae]